MIAALSRNKNDARREALSVSVRVAPKHGPGNAGELGVVQQNGRYLLVAAALLAEAESIFPACVALKVDPDAPAGDDPYADPQYQVPDDLIW